MSDHSSWLQDGFVNHECYSTGTRGLKDVQELVLSILNLLKRNLQLPCNSMKEFLEMHIVIRGHEDIKVTTSYGDEDSNLIGYGGTVESSA